MTDFKVEMPNSTYKRELKWNFWVGFSVGLATALAFLVFAPKAHADITLISVETQENKATLTVEITENDGWKRTLVDGICYDTENFQGNGTHQTTIELPKNEGTFTQTFQAWENQTPCENGKSSNSLEATWSFYDHSDGGGSTEPSIYEALLQNGFIPCFGEWIEKSACEALIIKRVYGVK